MKYFTEAWHGETNDAASNAVFGKYRQHLAHLLPHLPPDVQTLATRTNLHDGLLHRLVADPQQASLSLTLRCGDLQVGYFDLELHYFQVLFTPSLTEDLAGLIANPSNDDLHYYGRRSEALYDEVDMEEDWFVHRILFESRNSDYQELTVRFKQLHLRMTPRDSRYDTDN